MDAMLTMKMLLCAVPVVTFFIAFAIGYACGKSEANQEVVYKYKNLCNRCDIGNIRPATFSIIMDSRNRFSDFALNSGTSHEEKRRGIY